MKADFKGRGRSDGGGGIPPPPHSSPSCSEIRFCGLFTTTHSSTQVHAETQRELKCSHLIGLKSNISLVYLAFTRAVKTIEGQQLFSFPMANGGHEGRHQKVISPTRDTRVEANSRQQVQPSCPIDRIDFLRGEKRTNAASFRLRTELEIQLWSLTFLFHFSESAHSIFFFCM